MAIFAATMARVSRYLLRPDIFGEPPRPPKVKPAKGKADRVRPKTSVQRGPARARAYVRDLDELGMQAA